MEKGMSTHSSILAWESPQTEEPGKLQSMGVAKSQTRLNLHEHMHTYITSLQRPLPTEMLIER